MKILLFDIETSPNLSYTWGAWEQNVIEFEREWYLLSYAYKWLGDKVVKAKSLPDFKLYKKDKEDDTELVKSLHALMDEADVLIAHYGDSFDIKKANARFVALGLKPPSPYKSINTRKIARKYFKFNSNKLDDLAQHFGLGKKIKTDFELWKGCMDGDKTAWKKMVAYNKRDIELLEGVYYKFLPWIQNHPNLNILDDKECACPNCGSTKIQTRGWTITTVNKKRRYQCQSCGRWSVGRVVQTGIEIR